MENLSPFQDGQQHRRQKVTGVPAAGITLSGAEFEGCHFERCQFASSTFYRCTFRDCHFTGCDLSALKLTNTLLQDVRFGRSKLVGVDWTATGASDISRLMQSFSFEECVLDYATFFGMKLPKASFRRCHAHEVDFAEADLAGADFRGADLTASTFHHTNLERCDFTGAINYAIDPTTNRVSGAKFSLPEAISLLRGFDVVIEL